MCWKNKSFTIDARWTCRFTGVVRTFRAPESKSVPLHRASRHAWIDIISSLVFIFQENHQASSLRFIIIPVFNIPIHEALPHGQCLLRSGRRFCRVTYTCRDLACWLETTTRCASLRPKTLGACAVSPTQLLKKRCGRATTVLQGS
jgi:hypothetical protein